MRLIVAVRSSMNPWRTRCSVKMACCSTLLIGTNRMLGRETASQIASASLPSFLPLFHGKHVLCQVDSHSSNVVHDRFNDGLDRQCVFFRWR